MCDDGADDHLNVIVELVTVIVICNIFICVVVSTSDLLLWNLISVSERVSDDTRRSAFHFGEISFELFMLTALDDSENTELAKYQKDNLITV